MNNRKIVYQTATPQEAYRHRKHPEPEGIKNILKDKPTTQVYHSPDSAKLLIYKTIPLITETISETISEILTQTVTKIITETPC